MNTAYLQPQPSCPSGGDIRAVFVFFLCSFWLTNSGFDTSEGVQHYRVARHIIATGQLGFDRPREGIFTTAPNGRTYGSHEFGNTLFLIPVAAANAALTRLASAAGVAPERVARVEQFSVSFVPGMYATLTLTVLYLLLTREYGLTARAGFCGCAIVGFCTFLWDYSRSLFDGVLCGLLLTTAVWLLVRYRRTGAVTNVALAFAALGGAVGTRLSMIVPAVAAVGFLVAAGRRPVALAVAAAVLVPFAGWQLWYNHLRTGSALISPVQTTQYAHNNALDGDLATGATGLLFSPGKGLFVYAPFLLLSTAALPGFLRRDSLVGGFVLATGVLWLLLHAKLRSWYGAWGWGPRHFVTVVPLLALPGLVLLPEIWSRRWGRAAVIAAAAAGFVVCGSAIVANYHYQMELAAREGRLADEQFVWGKRNQAADALAGAARNFGVVAGFVPPQVIPEASDLNNYASNRVNVWWLTSPRAGVPVPVVAAGLVVLVAGLGWSAARIRA